MLYRKFEFLKEFDKLDNGKFGNNYNKIQYFGIDENMNNKADKYTGNKSFKDSDEFKAPNLEFNEKREYTELANKTFKTADPNYNVAEIEKAIPNHILLEKLMT